MRPLLSPYESDSIWSVDQQSKFVFTSLSRTQFFELENGTANFMKESIRNRKLVDPSQNF